MARGLLSMPLKTCYDELLPLEVRMLTDLAALWTAKVWLTDNGVDVSHVRVVYADDMGQPAWGPDNFWPILESLGFKSYEPRVGHMLCFEDVILMPHMYSPKWYKPAGTDKVLYMWQAPEMLYDTDEQHMKLLMNIREHGLGLPARIPFAPAASRTIVLASRDPEIRKKAGFRPSRMLLNEAELLAALRTIPDVHVHQVFLPRGAAVLEILPKGTEHSPLYPSLAHRTGKEFGRRIAMDGDPEEWPSDPAQLRQLDRSLRCQICGDIYTGPVALVCGHSFCSRCIRDSFNVRIQEGQAPVCPSCRTGCDQADLRPVTYLREASNAWRRQQIQHQAVGRGSGSRLRHSSEPCSDGDAITISSNSKANSQDEDACMSVESAGEACTAAADDADGDDAVDDPDWEDEEDEEQQQWQQQRGRTRNSRAGSQPPAASGAKRRLGRSDSNSAAAEPGAASGDDFELQQQPAKRPRSSQRTGKEQDVQQQLDAAPKQHEQQQQQQQPGKQAQLPPGCVACPICGLSVRAAFINSHVDTCLTRGSGGVQQQHTPARSSPPAAGSGAGAAPGKQLKQQQEQQQTPAGTAVAASHGTAGSGAAVARQPRVSSVSRGRVRSSAVLEAPPKLCFELLKERGLKAKLAGLGLSSEGTKKSCVDRYTAFRNYVLALKDSGTTNISLAAAAADFTKQQKRYARAAARGGGLGVLAAGAVTPAAGAAGTAGVGLGREQQVDDWARELGAVDSSYVALIQQTKQRMQQRRQQQNQEQGLEPDQQQQQEQDEEQEQQQEQQQQQQQSDSQRQPLKLQQPSQEQQQPRSVEASERQEWQGNIVEQDTAVQAQAVCGVQRQGSTGQAALAAEKHAVPQACSKAAALQQHQVQPGVVAVPESDEEL
ncbi:hypothetical protein COO60DRAFT_1628548 [Scenedesmus sp. NREL 46B-D3]|nr:hypothetical protein COO60DRAFT_1628548 [Scenedesmus sp. NREL 46B-D3]